MKTTKLFSAIAIALFFVSNAGAELTEGTILRFKLKAITQNTAEEEIRPDVYQSTTREIRVTNKEVLRAIQIFSVLPTFPNGTRLVAASDSLSAVAPDGTILATVDLQIDWSDEFEDFLETPDRFRGRARARVDANIDLGESLGFELDGLISLTIQYIEATDILSMPHILLSHLVGLGVIDGLDALFVGEISGRLPATIMID